MLVASLMVVWTLLQVILKEVEGKKCEPFEEALIEVPEEHVGPVMDLMGNRKGQMVDMQGQTGSLSKCADWPSKMCVQQCG